MLPRFFKVMFICVLFAGAGIFQASCSRADSFQRTNPAATAFHDVLDTPAQRSSLATSTLINGLALVGGRVIGVGQHGVIIYSDDEGKSWSQASVPVSADLTAVSFPTSKKGWAVGQDGVVLFSGDGGASWDRQLDGRLASRIITEYYDAHPPADLDAKRLGENIKMSVESAPDLPLLDVWFENETHGFAVGAFNTIFHTSDGGVNWEPWFDRTENEEGYHLYSIRSVDRDVYICGEKGMMLKLDREAGRFVKLVSPYKGTLFGITGNQRVVIAYGLRGNVLRSTDAGESWQQVDTGIPEGLIAGAMIADGRIVLVNQAGQLFASTDEGASFYPVTGAQPVPATFMIAMEKETVFLASFHGIRKESLK